MSSSGNIITLILPFILMSLFIAGIIVLIVVLVNKSNKKSNAQYPPAYQAEEMRKQRLIYLLHTQKNVPQETITMLNAMSFAQIQNFAWQNQLLDQQIMQQMSDPYLKSGVDHVVDQHHHGIDRGLEPQHDQHQMNNDNHNFGNGGSGNDSNGNNGM